ncbi:hypothetical protein F0562_025567 [Nyssa sinensis]|uniref:Uncharacterized protein n=1 Tax=Nyssa sinensis TaxID=561372 RepID=A0A5J5B6P0_9ASTE|nr:hypothetical protein F0562_025567 [Nyssa sinensis]
MLKDMAPGVKILWLWTIGTAAVLVTNVARTRLRDMEKLMNAEEQTPHVDSGLIGNSTNSDEFVREEES